jgi:hypothetical protein
MTFALSRIVILPKRGKGVDIINHRIHKQEKGVYDCDRIRDWGDPLYLIS